MLLGIKPIDGRQVRAARAALGVTLSDLAKRADLHRQSVHRIEKMRSIPGTSHYAALRLARALEGMGIMFTTQNGRPAVVLVSDPE